MISAPLYRDPIFDGAADPVLIFNRAERSWWMVYTARRAVGPELPGTQWIHGTDLGVASSTDGGASWTYRGVIEGLDLEWGRHTYWAPEIVDDGERYHMYVSVIRGVPDTWVGHERHIRHYTSADLLNWQYESTLELSSNFVIDACVARLPDGEGWRMWFKDEADGSSTWCADSSDLYSWRPGHRVVDHLPHEGPNVFALGGYWWMIIDEWRGQRVLRSTDLQVWEVQGLILDQPGVRPDDATIGLHADVVPTGPDQATIFYFTHPERIGTGHPDSYHTRRTSIQVARLTVQDGTLVCDRDAALEEPILPLS